MDFREENISNKPYGIAVYRLSNFKKWSWFSYRDQWVWLYSHTSYYKTKEAQRHAIFDLTKDYTNHKFIPFSNAGKHPVEVYGELLHLTEGFALKIQDLI